MKDAIRYNGRHPHAIAGIAIIGICECALNETLPLGPVDRESCFLCWPLASLMTGCIPVHSDIVEVEVFLTSG